MKPLRVALAAVLLAAGAFGATNDAVTSVSAASYLGPAAAPGSIVAAFGTNLASASMVASATAPLPQSLAGTTVQVTDSAGKQRTASLFFVSPSQVNYLLPEDTAEGAAVVAVAQGSAVQTGSLLIQKCAPGLFSANSDGAGVAAAVVSRYAGDKLKASNPVYRFNTATARYVAAAIDLGAENERAYLSLYGTGIRGAANVSVKIGGLPAAVSFKGAHSQYAGLDQVDVEIPRSLAGRSTVTVALTADNLDANPVTVDLLRPEYLNLDYETTSRGQLWKWSVYGPGYDFQPDTAVKHSGNQSLRIRNLSAATGFAYTYQILPLEAARGRHVRFTSQVKTEGMSRGVGKLWLRVDSDAGSTLSIDNSDGPTGTTDWTLCSIDRDISPAAAQIIIGVIHNGDGTAWYDSMTLEIDGQPYREAPAPIIGEPTAAQLDWVRQSAIPFRTPDAGSGLEDLEPLREAIGDAHVVGLGEATHGTSEFFRMKHRLLEFLATRMGFTVFAIEASMPEAFRVNDYVLNGVGDPKELLKGMYFWTWNTQEVLDMILWMRQFNLSGRGRLQFTGFDMQTAAVAMDITRAFVARVEPAYLGTLDAAWAQARTVASMYSVTTQAQRTVVEDAASAVRAVWKHLEENRAGYRASATGAEIEWAIQNGKIVEQATYVKIGSSSYRDICMAANTDWILRQNPPGTRIVLWAHNAHVSKSPGWMGSYLAQAHGPDYLVLGFVFHEGRYNAYTSATNGVLTANTAAPSFPGTVEYVFHSTGMPQFILDLRKAAADNPGAWLLGDIQYRDIGAVAYDGFRPTNRLTQDFDGLIYFERSTPSALLAFR